MSSAKEDALNEILTLASEHGIVAVFIDDSNKTVEVSAPHSLAVTGKMRGRPVEGSDRLCQRTLFLEISFREPITWTSGAGFSKPRYWN